MEDSVMNPSAQKDTAIMIAVGRLFDLERRVSSRAAGRIRNLTIESLGDSIVLLGETNTYFAKQLATQVCREQFRDVALLNNIEVI